MVRILFSLFLLLGCASAQAQGRHESVHTGMSGSYSAELLVSEHMHFTVFAQAMIMEHQGQVYHSVFLRQQVTEGTRMRIDSAWSFGEELAFEYLPGDRVCGPVRCLRNLGVLAFSEGEFNRLTGTGTRLRLIGSAGPVDLALPAQIFATAAALHSQS